MLCLPGLALTRLVNSARLLMGRVGDAASTLGLMATRLMGAKSLIGS